MTTTYLRSTWRLLASPTAVCRHDDWAMWRHSPSPNVQLIAASSRTAFKWLSYSPQFDCLYKEEWEKNESYKCSRDLRETNVLNVSFLNVRKHIKYLKLTKMLFLRLESVLEQSCINPKMFLMQKYLLLFISTQNIVWLTKSRNFLLRRTRQEQERKALLDPAPAGKKSCWTD